MSLREFVEDQSIALVGNSDRILRERPARQIDSADVVIRINLGLPGLVDPNAIGHRTDLWATAKYWPKALVTCTAKNILWMKLTLLGEQHLRQLCSDRNLNGKKLWVWREEDEAECRQFVGADPGTGIRLLWWLRNRAEPRSVSCYGMDCWAEGTVSHWSRKANTRNHDPELERIAMMKLL